LVTQNLRRPIEVIKLYSSIVLEGSPFGGKAVVVGSGSSYGDGGPATSAKLAGPVIPWVDSIGNIYVPDGGNRNIRKVTQNGIIGTFGGTTGTQSTSGTSGPISSNSFYQPFSIVGDSAGTFLYLSDKYYVWKYLFSTGIISVFVTHNGVPTGLWLTTDNDLFITDNDNSVIRKVSGGKTTTVVGVIGSVGYSGDGGPATSASLSGPNSVFVDSNGKMFIADTNNHAIRMVFPNGTITRFAGHPTGCSSSSCSGYMDNVPALSGKLNGPRDVKGDYLGNIFIADEGNAAIRMVDTNGIISTLFSNIDEPVGMWVDSLSSLYFVSNELIYKTLSAPSTVPTSFPTTPTVIPTLFPTFTQTQYPTFSPTLSPTVSLAPSFSPTQTPKPSISPTVLPTFSLIPSFTPTLQPTTSPTKNPTFFPSVIPTAVPTMYFTVICSTGESQCSGNSAYNNFLITATTDIVIVGSGNNDIFTFYPTLSQNSVVIKHFNTDFGNILAFSKFSDLSYTKIIQTYDPTVGSHGGIILTLPNKQHIIVEDVAMDIPASSMVFPASASSTSSSSKSSSKSTIAATVAGALSPVAYSALCYICRYPLIHARENGTPTTFSPSGMIYYFCFVFTGAANQAAEMAKEYWQKSDRAVYPDLRK
jgi:hypothetical protein